MIIGVGLVACAQLIPPPSPEWGSEHVARYYQEHRHGIRIGMVLTMMGSACFLTWGVCLAHQLEQPKMAAVLGIPNDWFQVALVPVAYTVGDDFKPSPRKPVDDVIIWNRFATKEGGAS